MALIHPSEEKIIEILKMADDGPVVFHNWLKFKPDGGLAAFQKYGEAFDKLMAPKGVKTIYTGLCQCTLIDDVEWDMIAIAEYPQLSVWKEMISSKAYHAISHYRDEGVIDTRLVVTKQMM
ncbi:MAG: DUF1330 domain-containing protein [Deltaproteobacteria bacterium]|jgi:uncharacterized protein (DUF1330 family)|nr:DUF1330 domain-containing protein [Deltaproteobacteria bacterium]MBT4642184.1 DUF1330 domain-containing protein [Deltaproteobacteria bacterium]MBT6499365.1 DUF1330 domain-containing protein [Deltaproteobacteria bacterium]MBT6610631.1 DUF1330 domain-containing protein [Deltaproteobacteria bacterium]MBT7710261.1 DUF1330 domain-containing protein [Deltaproteobacteria bacterium]